MFKYCNLIAPLLEALFFAALPVCSERCTLLHNQKGPKKKKTSYNTWGPFDTLLLGNTLTITTFIEAGE